MKYNRSILLLSIFAAPLLFSCNPEQQVSTGEGPDVTVVSYDETALMGDTVAYTVDLQGSTSLSTLKASLLFDESVVAEETIRTKDFGQYSGVLEVPFLANIPDGTATLKLVATNTALGTTETRLDVAVSRPDFEYLTLTLEDGTTYKMDKTERNVYAVEGDFPASVDAKIVTPKFGQTDTTLTFSWNVSAIELGDYDYIPFSNGVAGTYAISFNTLTYAGAPFISLSVNGVVASMADATTYTAVVNFTQGQEFKIEGYAAGFTGWTIDPDYLETVSDSGTYKFLAVDGLYKFSIQTGNEFFLVERMDSSTELGTLQSDGTGAVWMIGDPCYGKPKIFSYSWNPENGGLCLAEVSKAVHQITFVAGPQLSTSSMNVKLFHQKSWGGEFGDKNIITTDSELIIIGTGSEANGGNGIDAGNIHLAEGVTLEAGGIYRFTLDLTGYASSGNGVLHFAKVGQTEIEAAEAKINGYTLEDNLSNALVGLVQFEKGAAISVEGVDDIASYYIDPDYVSGYTFAASSGLYYVTVNYVDKFVSFRKMKSETEAATSLEGHAIYLLGWGGAHPSMANQFSWNESNGYAMAEVDDMVFQLTGFAVEETSTEKGGRFRYDYINIKYYGKYNSWDNECGKILGEETTVSLTDGAAKLIKLSGTNITLADGVELEKGATYVLTIDLSKAASDKIETIDFYKK